MLERCLWYMAAGGQGAREPNPVLTSCIGAVSLIGRGRFEHAGRHTCTSTDEGVGNCATSANVLGLFIRPKIVCIWVEVVRVPLLKI